MYYQYELAHYKGNMGHDATSDAAAREAGQPALAPAKFTPRRQRMPQQVKTIKYFRLHKLYIVLLVNLTK